MKRVSILFYLVLTVGLLVINAPAKTSQSSDGATEKEIVTIIQKLMDAIAVGDRSVWEMYVADDVIYTDENWKVLTKKDLIDQLAPLPKGYSGSIKVSNVRSRINGNSAVIVWDCLEDETVFGQRLTPVYLVTDTYFRRNGQWQLVASETIVKPSPRQGVTVDPKIYAELAGEYQLAPGDTYTVRIESGKLFGRRGARAEQELLAADMNTYFVKDTLRGEKIFVKGVAGKVIKMIDRRENNDLVWTKIR
ncbi:MAG: DUF4440 domain-containing protein [Acidobacteriota bacterium]